jgi:predicted permease
MGIPILEGRDFDRRNLKENARVAIVNQRFARHYFGERSAVGRHIGQGGPQAKLETEIIGVVADSLYEGPREGVHRQVFWPAWGNSGMTVYVRTSSPSPSTYALLRGEVKKLDAALPVYEMKTLANQLDETLLTERLIALLSAGFGLLATLLASVGLYGVMAFAVARRTKEMGVRMALGARRGSVVWLVMKEVLLLLSLGLAIGAPAAMALGKYISTQLYGIQPHDPRLAVMTLVVLFVVACTAGLIPARRASRIDPILALRYE